MNVLEQIQATKTSRIGCEAGVKLQEAGHQAFFAGGCVRDWLLGESPKDIDLTTSATPEQIAKVFPNTTLAGAHFGVAIVRHKGEMFEIATFRGDGEYGDGRRPDSVTFLTNPEEDVKRRDFTVNGLLADPSTGEVVDFVGGMRDIRDRLIQAIGNPTERFAEDHLRMLRAIRFASTKGFRIEPDTLAAIEEDAHNIDKVSAERVLAELHKIFGGQRAFGELRNLSKTGLMEGIFGSDAVLPSREAFMPTREIPGIQQRPLLVWAALFILNRHWLYVVDDIPFSNEDRIYILRAVTLFDRIKAWAALDVVGVKKLMRTKGFKDALELHYSLTQTVGAWNFFQEREEALEGVEPVDSLFPPKWLSGQDLIAMGLRPGPSFTAILTKIEDGQLRGEIRTKDDAQDLAEKMAFLFDFPKN